MNELWVAGYPSFVGGADTELDHMIDVWRHYDVPVHLVPMFGCDERMRELCDKRGCHTHEYHDGIFKDQLVISYCNGEFLKKLPQIMDAGRPAKVLWANCIDMAFRTGIGGSQTGVD